MRVRTLALLLLFSVLAGAVAYLIMYFYVPQESPGMGRETGSQTHLVIPVLVISVAFSVGLVAYLALFPEIRQTPSAEKALPPEQKSLEAVMKVLKDDERKVEELLMTTEGTMLQSDIARKTGFTRVKTHRILHRLSTQGIVTG